MEFISKLKHLISFRFEGFAENNELFCDSLKRIANNCQTLKRFECNLDNTENLDIKQIFSSIKAFPALKRLYLRFCANFDRNVFNDLFSFEAFKGLSNITQLTLYFHSVTFKETTLKDIDINLPNLQYLVLENSFRLDREGVTQMADILSRLSRLQTLKLRFKSGVDYKPIEEQITEKCRKIKEIEMRSVSDTDSDEDYGYGVNY